MPDIVSKILLQAQGGDQVAREIGKVKKAYQEAGSAAQGINPSGGGAGGTDAFARAMGGGGGAVPSSGTGGGGDALRERMRERDRQHFERTTGSGVGGGISRTLTGGINAIGAAGSGNMAGGVQGMLGALGSLGKLGVAGIVAGATVGAVNQLSEKDLELRGQIWSGVGQKLNQKKFETMRDSLRDSVLKAGLDPAALPMLQSISEFGAGDYNPEDLKSLLAVNYNTGTNVGSLGRMYGRLKSAGSGGRTTFNPDMTRAAEQGFGRGRMSEFYDTVSEAIEGAMSRGFEKGSSIFTDSYKSFAQSLGDIGRFGGVTPDAAMGIYRKVQGGIARSDAGLSTGEDAMQFMMLRKPGESYLSTLKKMSDPRSEISRYQNLKSMAGGNRDSLIQMVMSEYGMGVREAEAYVRKADMRINLDSMTSLATGGTGAVDYTQLDSEDETLRRRAAKATRGTALEGVSRGAGGVMAWITELVGGKALSPAAAKMKALAGDAKIPDLMSGGQQYLQYMPDSLLDFATGAFGNKDIAKNNPLFQQVLPMLGMYGGWKSGKVSVSKSQEEYFKQYSPAFEALSTSGLDKGDTTSENLKKIISTLGVVDEENKLDGIKNLYTILEVLESMARYMKEGGVSTPTGGSK
jgi:hypothetical protein